MLSNTAIILLPIVGMLAMMVLAELACRRRHGDCTARGLDR